MFLKKLFFVLILLSLPLNGYFLFQDEIVKVYKYKKLIPHQSIGFRYEDLVSHTNNIPIVGYITDRELGEEENAKEFAYAQFMLAPTILDFNNPEHEYILFDYSSPQESWERMLKMNAHPVYGGKYGLLLTQRNL